MNPGYVSYVWMSAILILLISGWKDILFRGLSRTTILLFFAGWLPFSLIRIPIGGFLIGMSALFLLALAMAGIWALKSPMLRVHVCSAGLLLGMFDFLMLELNGRSLILDRAGIFFHPVLLLSVLTMLLGRQALWQFVALTLGLLTAEGLHGWLHRQAAPVVVMGGAAFGDHWWSAVCLARGLTVTAESTMRLMVGAAKHWTNRHKEWRE